MQSDDFFGNEKSVTVKSTGKAKIVFTPESGAAETLKGDFEVLEGEF